MEAGYSSRSVELMGAPTQHLYASKPHQVPNGKLVSSLLRGKEIQKQGFLLFPEVEMQGGQVVKQKWLSIWALGTNKWSSGSGAEAFSKS